MSTATEGAVKEQAKAKKPKEEPFAWKPGEGGLLKGTKFAKPPCPVGFHGFHNYQALAELQTRNCRVYQCRLCDRTLGVNRKSGHVRERSAAWAASHEGTPAASRGS